MTGPLAGLRIFDLTRILAGPTATQVLGDLGADVIKVERPDQGDDTRKWGPPYVKDAAGRDTCESAYFLAANRNKRSITIDLEMREGQALARRLIAKSDVLFENFKVGNLAKYGLAYDQLKDELPGLIYCSLTGFGQTGPYAPRAGYDLAIQAMGGLMSITGERNGPPVKVGVGIADLVTGHFCIIAILAALHHRHQTGQGQHIDMALLDSQVSILVNEGLNHLIGGVVPRAWGTEHATIVPYGAFPTADGHVILAIGNDGQFRKFCAFADAAALADDARYKTNSDRMRHRDALREAISARTRTQPTQYWVDGLAPLGVPCGPVNTIDKVFQDPQVKARGMQIAMEHPMAGRPVPLIASPIKMSKTPVDYRHAPPTLGQHTDEVLREVLDMGEAELKALRDKGVI
ncbi:MAG: CaiB/BaiF CoA transferase family protein [Candidatus Eiseniibacteriota bacterium]